MYKLMLLVALLAMVVGCGTTGGPRVMRLSPDQQVLADRQAVITTATDPQTERSAQEWARIAADRERQQMEYNLRQQELNARRAQQYAYQAEQKERSKAQREWAENQQKIDAARELGYQLQNAGRNIQYRQQQQQWQRVPRR